MLNRFLWGIISAISMVAVIIFMIYLAIMAISVTWPIFVLIGVYLIVKGICRPT